MHITIILFVWLAIAQGSELEDMKSKLRRTPRRALDKRTSVTGTTRRGGNGDLKYCEGAHDMESLVRTKIPVHGDMRPRVDIRVDEIRSVVFFSVDVLYIPFDARWTVGFDYLSKYVHELLKQTKSPSACSLYFDGQEQSVTIEGDDIFYDNRGWEHAPNAKYEGALSSPIDYPAYYVPPGSKWNATSRGCSRVRYEAEFTIDELLSCQEPLADAKTSGLLWTTNGDVRILTTSLFVALSLPSDPLYAQYRFDTTLYVDEHDSKIFLLDDGVASTPQTTQVRDVHVDKDQKLHIVLQTVMQGGARNLTLVSISSKDHESTFALTTTRYEPSYRYDDGMYLQNWYLESLEGSDLFEGTFSLLFSDRDDTDSHHMTHMTVFVANPQDVDFSRQPLHSEITPHKDSYLNQVQHVGGFDDGSRACMQTYIIGSTHVSRMMHISLSEAWICTASDDEALLEEDVTTLLCKNRPHSTKLYDAATGRTDPFYNVTVHYPGVYGPLSVALCFDTTANFKDHKNMTITRKNQRYETVVALKVSQKRKGQSLTDNVKSMFAQLSAKRTAGVVTNLVQTARIDMIDSQMLQTGPFSDFRFEKTLQEARKLGLTKETHAHVFHVARPNMEGRLTSAEATAVVLSIVASAFCVFCCFLVASKRGERRKESLNDSWRGNHAVNH